MGFKVSTLAVIGIIVFFSILLIPYKYGYPLEYYKKTCTEISIISPEGQRGVIDIYFYQDNLSLLPRICNITIANSYVKQSWFEISNITLNTAIYEGWSTTWCIEYNTDNGRYQVSFVVNNMSAFRDMEFFLYDFSEFDTLHPIVFAKEIDDIVYINATHNNLSWSIMLSSTLGGFCLIAQVLNSDSYITGGYLLENISLYDTYDVPDVYSGIGFSLGNVITVQITACIFNRTFVQEQPSNPYTPIDALSANMSNSITINENYVEVTSDDNIIHIAAVLYNDAYWPSNISFSMGEVDLITMDYKPNFYLFSGNVSDITIMCFPSLDFSGHEDAIYNMSNITYYPYHFNRNYGCIILYPWVIDEIDAYRVKVAGHDAFGKIAINNVDYNISEDIIAVDIVCNRETFGWISIAMPESTKLKNTTFYPHTYGTVASWSIPGFNMYNIYISLNCNTTIRLEFGDNYSYNVPYNATNTTSNNSSTTGNTTLENGTTSEGNNTSNSTIHPTFTLQCPTHVTYQKSTLLNINMTIENLLNENITLHISYNSTIFTFVNEIFMFPDVVNILAHDKSNITLSLALMDDIGQGDYPLYICAEDIATTYNVTRTIIIHVFECQQNNATYTGATTDDYYETDANISSWERYNNTNDYNGSTIETSIVHGNGSDFANPMSDEDMKAEEPMNLPHPHGITPFNEGSDEDNNTSVEDEDQSLVIIALIIAVVTISTIFGVVSGMEIGRYHIYRGVILPFAPFYSRINRDNVLENVRRKMIYEYIKNNPGVNLTHLMLELKLPNGTVIHHIRLLERNGLIVHRRDGRKMRFYPTHMGFVADDGLSWMQLLILETIIENHGATLKDLSKILCRSKQVLSYHLRILIDSGYVFKKRVKNIAMYYPTEKYLRDLWKKEEND